MIVNNNNPCSLNVWDIEIEWPFPLDSPSPTSGSESSESSTSSPSSSSFFESSLPSGSPASKLSDSHRHPERWRPVTPTFGTLVMTATPGTLPPGMTGPTLDFRFTYRSDRAEIAIIGPGNRACYYLKTVNYKTYIISPTAKIAMIVWPLNGEPRVIFSRVTYSRSALLYKMHDTNVVRMISGAREYYWCSTAGRTYLYSQNTFSQVIGVVQNYSGIQFRVTSDNFPEETFDNMIASIIIMQGRQMVGLA